MVKGDSWEKPANSPAASDHLTFELSRIGVLGKEIIICISIFTVHPSRCSSPEYSGGWVSSYEDCRFRSGEEHTRR